MAKKKKLQKIDAQSTGPTHPRSICPALKSKTSTTPKSSSPALNICRNKHWRYISSFHGSWLQLPLEVLETLAINNYSLPRPRPIDPAVFFDIFKIRQLVEDATNLSVRATSGVASSSSANILNYSNGRLNYGNMLGIGVGGRVVNTKLSKERKHRMREQAIRKLSKAYHLDEIACSVATMQSASTLEDVAQLVLQRNSNDVDAKYVHFFHEKIPSRQLAESTTLQSLNEIVSERPSRSEILRTRAVTKIFKEDLIGAAQDLTTALQICKFYQKQHKIEQNQLNLSKNVVIDENCKSQRAEDVNPNEAHRPSGLETQLLFHRAGVYLSIACQKVSDSFMSQRSTTGVNQCSNLEGGTTCMTPKEKEMTISEIEAQQTRQEARRNVKTYAKRALKDYLAYLSHFDYTPGFSGQTTAEATLGISKMSDSSEISRSQILKNSFCDSHYATLSGTQSFSLPSVKISPPSPKVHNMSSLFSATPPPDLPPYPETKATPVAKEQLKSVCNDFPKTSWTQSESNESLTYHPLMTDALHSLLLCHCLIQTSVRELKRHAYMVSRLARVCNGYPIFQTPRSPSRADWIEVLRHCENWIQLSSSWESLCNSEPSLGKVSVKLKDKTSTENHIFVKQNILPEPSQDFLNDGDVSIPNSSFERQIQPEKGDNSCERRDIYKRWAQKTGKEYPSSTERACAIICWINEASVPDDFCNLREKKENNNSIDGGRIKNIETKMEGFTLTD